MSAPFLRPSQVAAIAASWATQPMIDGIEVYRRDAAEATPGNDYGDDMIAYTITPDSRRHTVRGWLYSTPAVVQQVDSGAIITVNTYVLRVANGTDVHPGDEVVIAGEQYTVSSTNEENTWQAFVDCNLRKRQ